MEAEKKKTVGRKISIIQLLLLAVAIICIVFLANDLSENRVIKEILVSGNSILPTDEILTPSLKKIADTSKGSDIIFRLSNFLKTNPYISDAFVSFQGSDKLLIEIKERQPVAIVIDNYGYPGFLCSDGKLLPYSHLSNFINLPLMRNVLTVTSSDTYAMAASLKILNALSEQQNQFIQQNISEIIFEGKNSFYFVSSGFGIKIYFGSAEDAMNKLKKLSIFWEHEMPRISPARIKYVDVRWVGQVVVNIT